MDKRKIDFCKYFADIEADPSAKTLHLSVREFLQAKQHVYDCDVCYNRMLRVTAKEQYPDRSQN